MDPVYDPFDFAVQEDPHPVYAWMREHAPLYRNEKRDFWALSRHADVSAALRDPGRFSSRNGISLEPELWGPDAKKTNFFLAMDPPEHAAYRSLVSSAFTPRRVAALEPRIRELARARLAPLRDRESFDFADDFAADLPNDMLCEILGLPRADWDRIRRDVDDLVLRDDGSERRGEVSVAAALRLAAYLLDVVATLRRRPGDDLTSGLTQAEVDGTRLTDRQVVGFLFIMLGGGNESTGKTIGNAWYQGHLDRDVQRAGLDGRAEDWASETLRYDSASQMVARMLTRETVLHGVTVPAGARVALLPASANRDRRVFPDPDRFDLDRDTGRLISFGLGPHHCLGAALARLEMRVALEEVGALVAEYDVDEAASRRCHSPHQHGFLALPCTVRWRRRAAPVPPTDHDH
ncbi:cytochrome P450 [Plantactinospora sp. KBS50]|uniref:cytochrome P450 n=1 Tax=Plantactinospora sp. KBS50 TaxID=2024580 RepID=UPI000BAAA149|nr:cytochrome P450 [Plantactinospora sp. KBS50]ASW54301.1 cytochrome [Plantactinospora sp. KBS50]